MQTVQQIDTIFLTLMCPASARITNLILTCLRSPKKISVVLRHEILYRHDCTTDHSVPINWFSRDLKTSREKTLTRILFCFGIIYHWDHECHDDQVLLDDHGCE